EERVLRPVCGVCWDMKRVDPTDVWATEPLRKLHFSLELGDYVRIERDFRPDCLERDSTKIEVDRFVDLSHSAATDQTDDSELVPHQFAVFKCRPGRLEEAVKVDDRTVSPPD